MAVFAEVHKALNLRGQRHAGTLGLYHQQHRQAQRIRQFPSAGTGGQALTIIKPIAPSHTAAPCPAA